VRKRGGFRGGREKRASSRRGTDFSLLRRCGHLQKLPGLAKRIRLPRKAAATILNDSHATIHHVRGGRGELLRPCEGEERESRGRG